VKIYGYLLSRKVEILFKDVCYLLNELDGLSWVSLFSSDEVEEVNRLIDETKLMSKSALL